MKQEKIKKTLMVFIILVLFIIIANIILILYYKNIDKNAKGWIKYENNPVIGDETTGYLFDPYVFLDKDGTYRMYVSSRKNDAISVTTSEDGINWNKYENPVLEANKDKNALDSFKVGGCDVHKLSNNSYIMFYIGYTSLYKARIFVAKSQDGTNWERTGRPIIVPEKGKFDYSACYKPSAILDSENNRCMLWYNGRALYDEYIGLAIYNEK